MGTHAMLIGDRLRAIREAKNLSSCRLARNMGCVNRTVKGSSTHKLRRPWELVLTRDGGGVMPFAKR